MRGGNPLSIRGNAAIYTLGSLVVFGLCAPGTAGAEYSGQVQGDALPLINATHATFLRTDPAMQDRPLLDSYVDQVLSAAGNRVFRFTSMPITVHINDFPDRDFMNAVKRGLTVWELATNGLVRFVLVDDPQQARLQIGWKHLGTSIDSSGCTLAAHTLAKYPAGNVRSSNCAQSAATGQGQTQAPAQSIDINLDLIMSKQPDVRLRILQNLVSHESGHALGLLGHSSNINDMMYAITDEHSRISSRDIETLRKLYSMNADVVF